MELERFSSIFINYWLKTSCWMLLKSYFWVSFILFLVNWDICARNQMNSLVSDVFGAVLTSRCGSSAAVRRRLCRGGLRHRGRGGARLQDRLHLLQEAQRGGGLRHRGVVLPTRWRVRLRPCEFRPNNESFTALGFSLKEKCYTTFTQQEKQDLFLFSIQTTRTSCNLRRSSPEPPAAAPLKLHRKC